MATAPLQIQLRLEDISHSMIGSNRHHGALVNETQPIHMPWLGREMKMEGEQHLNAVGRVYSATSGIGTAAEWAS